MPAATAVVGISSAELMNGSDTAHMNGKSTPGESSTSDKVLALASQSYLHTPASKRGLVQSVSLC